jgi:hypothetical protein
LKRWAHRWVLPNLRARRVAMLRMLVRMLEVRR